MFSLLARRSTRVPLGRKSIVQTYRGTVVAKEYFDGQVVTRIKEQKKGRMYISSQDINNSHDINESCEPGDEVTFEIGSTGFATEIIGAKKLETFQDLNSRKLFDTTIPHEEFDITDEIIPPLFATTYDEIHKQKKKIPKAEDPVDYKYFPH